MEFLLLGLITGFSLIIAIGAQNIFVIEQGLKKQNIFLICLICSVSDLILIFLGIFLFHYFIEYFSSEIELIFNILLIIFLIHFIYSKIKKFNYGISVKKDLKHNSKKKIIFKTLSFTYLNPHVYSDTVFFLGNFSKNFIVSEKINFGIGAVLSSFIFFFVIGYTAKYLSKFIHSKKLWKAINSLIIIFMSGLILLIISDIFIS